MYNLKNNITSVSMESPIYTVQELRGLSELLENVFL